MLSKLQLVLRSAVRLIARRTKFERISAYMHDTLHWLPFPSRIEFRILRFVGQCLNCVAPSYLHEFCCRADSTSGAMRLRSSTRGLLLLPFSRTSIFRNRAFATMGLDLLNLIDMQLRQTFLTSAGNIGFVAFLRDLKTFLFSL